MICTEFCQWLSYLATHEVHVSSCGSHLVCVSQDGYIYIIRNFEMSLHPSNATENLITALFVQNRITSMDYEDERIAFYTTVAIYMQHTCH